METTYRDWSNKIKEHLLDKDLWDVIDWRITQSNAKIADYETWAKKNEAALNEIRDSCKPHMKDKIKEIKSAKIAWDTLAKMFHPNAPGSIQTRFNTGDLSEVMGVRLHKLPPYHGKIDRFFYDWKRRTPLRKAVYRGDWNAVKALIDDDRKALTAKISGYGNLLIHAAAEGGHLSIVEKLVDLMSREDLEIQNSFGRTALSFASIDGNFKMAKCIVQKNDKLLEISDIEDRIPVVAACMAGHKDLTMYLYSQTPCVLLYPENGPYGSMLLYNCIYNKMLDIALELLQICPLLALTHHGYKLYPFRVLANTPLMFLSGCKLTFWEKWIYSRISIQLQVVSKEVCVNIQPRDGKNDKVNIISQAFSRGHKIAKQILKFIGFQKIHHMKLTHTYALEVLKRVCEAIATPYIENIGTDAFWALDDSINYGIIEYVVEMTKANPDFLYFRDKGRNLLMKSILSRQEQIFNLLLYGVGARKDSWIADKDDFGNNVLHLAAMLSPPRQFECISGAALQMQRELQWFEKVKSIMVPSYIESKNKDQETPRELFTKSHKELRKEGEEWMKVTATSCTVVGALIITIMFAATFTIPGGIVEDTRVPFFLHDNSFKAFIISDAISLLSSSTSVLMFLGILTSCYAEEDFLERLPRKLIIGLSTLFISIATMMVAFCSTLILMLPGNFPMIVIIMVLAGVPVTLFILLQFPLLVEIFRSTYGQSIFNKKMKH